MSEAPSMNPPQIVVTGAAGFIGRRVVARLAAAGARVLAADRMPAPAEWPAGVEHRRAELGEGIPGVEDGHLLVHLAWNMDRGSPEAQAESVAGFGRLLEHPGLRGVVGMGSAEEYGELEGQLSEDMAPGLHLSAYGRAKHEACRALELWTERDPLRRAIWLRPFIVYGPGQGGSMAIPTAMRSVAERRRAEFSEGLQFRDFVHVDDVADGIAHMARRLAEQERPFTVCNLGRGEPVQLREVLERIASDTGAGKWFHFGARPMREGEPREQYADVMAAEMLGWQAKIPWRQGIDALCRGQGGETHG